MKRTALLPFAGCLATIAITLTLWCCKQEPEPTPPPRSAPPATAPAAAPTGAAEQEAARLKELAGQLQRLAADKTAPFPVAALASKPVEKDGMSVTVTLAKASFAADESPRFTVHFKNISDKPLALYDVDWFWNWSIRFADVERQGPWEPHLLIMVKRAPQTRICKPGETLDVLVDLSRDPSAVEFVWKGMQLESIGPIKQLHPGKYELEINIALQKGADNPDATSWTGPVKLEPLGFEITAQPAASQPARTKTNEKGWELCVWQDNGQTYYSLMPGSNRVKTSDERTKAAVKTLDAVKAQLAEIKPGQSIYLTSLPFGAWPPEDATTALNAYCAELNITVLMQK